MESTGESSSARGPGTLEGQGIPLPNNTIALRDKDNDNATPMTPNERAALLLRLAPRCERALPDLGTQSFDTPDELSDDLKADAKKLFLKRTTFFVTCWINFDTAAEQFYGDNRVNDCGKLQMSGPARSHLNSIDPHDNEMVKVRFNIATPWHNLFTVAITSVGKRRIEAKIDEKTTTNEDLLAFGEKCCKRIKSAGIIYGKRDMTLQDLEAFATVFIK